LKAEAVQAYAVAVKPSFARLHAFLAEKYLPGARKATAATALPDGQAWYAWRVKTETSTDLTPREIHDIGLAEVKRIRSEMERVKGETGFKGSLPEFLSFCAPIQSSSSRTKRTCCAPTATSRNGLTRS